MRPLRLFAATMLALAAPVVAQAPAPAPTPPVAPTPPGWAWRTDTPATPRRGSEPATESSFEFSLMAPGWHVTMGPGGVLYDPRERVSGRFTLAGELILFPDASDEEYGVFVGGAALDEAGATWIAFVVRGDGSAAVMQHRDGTTSLVLPWAIHRAVKRRVAGESAQNLVSVRAEADSVRFDVNGERVAAWPRAAIAVDGAIGLRVGRAVNLHVTNLDLTRRLAPPRRR